MKYSNVDLRVIEKKLIHALLLGRFANEESTIFLNNEIISSYTSGYNLTGTTYTITISVLVMLAEFFLLFLDSNILLFLLVTFL